MFTLQILDRGQTFLHAIDGKTILLGSDPTADVVLMETGIALAHARIEPHAAGARLVAEAETRVNGQIVARVDLALGDRIEIGRAVLVVGRAVTRAASPDDVLMDVVPRSRRARKSRSLLVPTLVVLAAVGIGAWIALGVSSVQQARDEIAGIQRHRLAGQFDVANARIAALQREWSDATDKRLVWLASEREALAAVEAAVARLMASVLDPRDARGYAAWSQELERLEHDGETEMQVAARFVRANLAATLRNRPAAPAVPVNPDRPANSDLAVAQAVAAPGSSTPSPAPTPAPPPPIASSTPPASSPPTVSSTQTASTTLPTPPASTAPTMSPTAPPADTTEADRLAAQGLFAQAMAVLQTGLEEQDSEAAVARLQARAAEVREQAKQAMSELLVVVGREVAAGNALAAAKRLQAERHRFPPHVEFAAIDDEIRRCEAAVVAKAAAAKVSPPVDEVARAATLAAVRAWMDNVRLAEEQGAFRVACEQLRAAADAVKERDADFAKRLVLRADEAELLAAWHEAVASALQGGRTLATQRANGQAITLAAVDGSTFTEATGARLTWNDIGPAGVQALAEQVKVAGPPALGAAAMLYKLGQGAVAESMLAKLVRAEPACQAGVDRVIARGRGEPFDARGYALGKDGFQSVRSLEIQKQAAQLATRLDAALRDKNPGPREALWNETLAAGPEAAQVMVAALQKELQKQVAKLDTGTLRKQVDRLAAQRLLLDQARQSAKELIYDEKKYFYPYRPPAVSSDRYAEYVRVQEEVDRRVAELRTMWSDDRTKVRVPTSLRADLDRLDWLAKGLAGLGELDAGVLAQIEWVRALPPGDSVGVRDYCATMAERSLLEEWHRIEDYNTIVGKSLTSAQREQLKITNEYRVMFHHRPLAVVPLICTASQGHADEMSRLGYFAHTSPTPGRKTPYDRMRLAGYLFGVSENIALVDGAGPAHVAWCHSSGHHRNLLDAGHREMGIGANGRYWVQNFGSGTGHRDDPAWGARPNAR